MRAPGHETTALSAPARVAVLASGGGTNLQALIDRFHAEPAPAARVELVVASRVGTLIHSEVGPPQLAREAGTGNGTVAPPGGACAWLSAGTARCRSRGPPGR